MKGPGNLSGECCDEDFCDIDLDGVALRTVMAQIGKGFAEAIAKMGESPK